LLYLLVFILRFMKQLQGKFCVNLEALRYAIARVWCSTFPEHIQWNVLTYLAQIHIQKHYANVFLGMLILTVKLHGFYWSLRLHFPMLVSVAPGNNIVPPKYRVIHKPLRDFRPLRYSSRDGHAEGEHVNRGRDTPSFCPTLQLLLCCFLLCLSWLLCGRVRKFRRDLWITLYMASYFRLSSE
jgi:hypothetical protein